MKIERPQAAQPIPPHAQKVFSGVLFDVYQWEQELFDGSTTMFEKMKRPDTVVVFPVLEDGRILLTKQEQPGKLPFIGATGGRIDEGEEVIDAAKRELLEESGHEAEEFMLWKALHPVGKIDWVVYLLIAKGAKEVGDMSLDAGEKVELYPVTFDEFLSVVADPTFVEVEILPEVLRAQTDPENMRELKALFGV